MTLEQVNITNNFPRYMQHGVTECEDGHAFTLCRPGRAEPEDCPICKREGGREDAVNKGMERKRKS